MSSKGIRVQAVLPGATATEFWSVAEMSIDQLPAEMVMTTEDMVDAALSGLKQGELVTIPSLPTQADWNAFESARKAFGPKLSREQPAERYQVRAAH